MSITRILYDPDIFHCNITQITYTAKKEKTQKSKKKTLKMIKIKLKNPQLFNLRNAIIF